MLLSRHHSNFYQVKSISLVGIGTYHKNLYSVICLKHLIASSIKHCFSLSYYGIKDRALDLIASYLSDSNQMVGINYLKSQSSTTVMSVIPQGSIVGPFRLLVYINDSMLVTLELWTV